MQLLSPVFKHNEFIPLKYTCEGQNINPPLEIYDAPETAKSLALVVDDPDASAGTWTHWVLWNIDPQAQEIPEGNITKGSIEGVNSFKKLNWGGPCPPSGVHRYFFKLYALDISLELDSTAGIEQLQEAMKGHVMAKTELVGLYKRNPPL